MCMTIMLLLAWLLWNAAVAERPEGAMARPVANLQQHHVAKPAPQRASRKTMLQTFHERWEHNDASTCCEDILSNTTRRRVTGNHDIFTALLGRGRVIRKRFSSEHGLAHQTLKIQKLINRWPTPTFNIPIVGCKVDCDRDDHRYDEVQWYIPGAHLRKYRHSARRAGWNWVQLLQVHLIPSHRP